MLSIIIFKPKKYLLIIKVFQCSRYLVLLFLIENDFEGSSVVINFKGCSHWFFNSLNNSSYHNDLSYINKLQYINYFRNSFSINFTNIFRCYRSFLYHFNCYWSKDSVFAVFLLVIISLFSTIFIVSSHIVNEKSWIIICKL